MAAGQDPNALKVLSNQDNALDCKHGLDQTTVDLIQKIIPHDILLNTHAKRLALNRYEQQHAESRNSQMPTYIALMNWTDQGIRNVKDTPKRAENAKALARKMGGKLDIHYTMGEYDAVAMIEMPNDEAYNRFALTTAAMGNIRTKTLKAWTLDEFQKVVDQLP